MKAGTLVVLLGLGLFVALASADAPVAVLKSEEASASDADVSVAVFEAEADKAPAGEAHATIVLHHDHHGHSHHALEMDAHGRLREANHTPHVIQHWGHTHTEEETLRDSGYIFSIMMVVMILAQLGLVSWKKLYPKSFNTMTLLGLWAMPLMWSVSNAFWRFLVIATSFSGVTGFVLFRATRQPIARGTPRLVFTWFIVIYKFCYGLAVAGYALMMCDFFGISQLFPSFLSPAAPVAIMWLSYGLYFGVLGRDCAQVCTEMMANKIGYYSKDGIPARTLGNNTCAMCDNTLFKNLRLGQDDSVNETVCTLSCQHQFHESCIRGWLMVGKRDTCPNCSEKVNLRETFTNPWETQGLAWGAILDLLRYLIVYNPVIVIMMQMALWLLY